MPQLVSSCPKILGLLSRFCDAARGDRAPQAEMIDAAEVPEPFRTLLVHNRDMTSTLAGYHGEDIALRVLHQEVAGGVVRRNVILEGERSVRPLEYGASQIRLDVLDGPGRAGVLQGRVPLGGILNKLGVPYESCPGGFFRVRPEGQVARALALDAAHAAGPLYGRCNCLTCPDGRTIAEVVEILPPDSECV